MKKIVGIIAAVAMAASVFGAEVSGAIRLSGDLFNYNGEKEEMQLLKLTNENQFWHSPVTFSVSTDNVGATWKWTDADGDALKTGKWAIWFKPVDALKINLGTIDKSMNNDSIDWTNRLINYDNWGVAVDFAAGGFNARLSLVNGKNTFFFQNGMVAKNAAAQKAYDDWLKDHAGDTTGAQNAKDAVLNGATPDSTFGEINVYADYSAAFGTISAMYDYGTRKYFDANGVKVELKTNSIGAGYKGSFGDITIFADGAVYLPKDNDAEFGGDFDFKYSANGLTFESYTQFLTYAKADLTGNALMEIAKVSYALDNGMTPYLYFKDANFMADDFACTIKPGFTASFGAMSYEMAVQIDIADKVNVSVPVNFSVKF